MNNYYALIPKEIDLPDTDKQLFITAKTLNQATYKVDIVGRFKKNGYKLFKYEDFNDKST